MAQDLTPLEAEKLKQDRTSVERDFWQKLRIVARKVPFIDELVAVYYCAMDPETPAKVKFILYGALAYFILPFDFVAHFSPRPCDLRIPPTLQARMDEPKVTALPHCEAGIRRAPR